MVFIEKTKDVQHRVADNYLCVRIHFFEKDTHFWLKRVQTPQGESVANWMPWEKEIVSLVQHRMECPDPLDFLWRLHSMLLSKGFKIEKKGGGL